ncbi:MAG: lactonase family protein [Bacteroidota bacterium]
MKPTQIAYLLILIMSGLLGCQPTEEPMESSPDSHLFFVGTYTQKEGHVDGKAAGIYVCGMDKKTGTVSMLDTLSGITNPSYLTPHPNGKFVYAVSEIAAADAYVGEVVALAFDPETQQLSHLNAVSSHGNAPCHISVAPDGSMVLVANYVGGTVAGFPLKEDGSLAEASSVHQHAYAQSSHPRQEAAHAHMIQALDEQYVLAADLGSNQLIHYSREAGDSLALQAMTTVQAEGGPRHFACHPEKNWLYVLNELSATVELYDADSLQQSLPAVQRISTISDSSRAVPTISCAAIHLHPNGRFLYVSNRGLGESQENSIASFAISPEDGQLSFLGSVSSGGSIPRDFAISPDGKFLVVANQNSDNLLTYSINEAGLPVATGQEFSLPTPVCLKFWPGQP